MSLELIVAIVFGVIATIIGVWQIVQQRQRANLPEIPSTEIEQESAHDSLVVRDVEESRGVAIGTGSRGISTEGGDYYEIQNAHLATSPENQELNKSALHITFDLCDSSCKQQWQGTIGHGQLANFKLYRVRVTNIRAKTIEKVRVQLESSDPSIFRAHPIPLHKMFDNTPPFTQVFALFPRETAYIDVIQQVITLNKDANFVTVRHIISGVGDIQIPVGQYKLTISAYGDNTAPCFKSFAVSFDGDDVVSFQEII